MGVDQFRANGSLRGFKRDLYEGGIRVPFIARWPGQIKAGASNEVFAFWDLLPTFAELTKQKAPTGLDGISVLNAMLGRGSVQSGNRHLYWEFHERGFQQAVRWRQWKGIRLKQGEAIELYDLESDPSEQVNLARRRPEIRDRLSSMIDSSRSPSSYWP